MSFKKAIYALFLIILSIMIVNCGGLQVSDGSCSTNVDCQVGESCNTSIATCEKERLPGIGMPCKGRGDEACPHHLICGAGHVCTVPVCYFDIHCKRHKDYGNGYRCVNGFCEISRGC